MRCTWLRTLTDIGVSFSILALSGCYSMNGYVTNANGQGYYDQGNYAMAAQEFQSALSSQPGNPDYMANLAKARMKMGDTSGAEQLYRQALTQSPAHQPSYHGYSELLIAQGRQQDALRMMKTWAATQPYIAESHVELAWLQRELGQPDAAAQSLQTALQVNPNHATALAHLGQYYEDMGQGKQAIAMYQQSLQANWNQPQVQSRLASTAATVGAGHPMGEIAMARGVHPHSIPVQQLAGGMQTPAMVQTPMVQHHMAFQAPVQGVAPVAYQPPTMLKPTGTVAGTPTPGVPGATATDPMLTIPPMFSGNSGDVVVSEPTTPAPAQASSANLPSPVPDPAFSESSTPLSPITSVSQTKITEDGIPEVDAF